MSHIEKQQLSTAVSSFLDEIGFSQSKIRSRANVMQTFVGIISDTILPVTYKTNCIDFQFDKLQMVGSTGEGLEPWGESDCDYLLYDSRDYRMFGEAEAITKLPGYAYLSFKQSKNVESEKPSFLRFHDTFPPQALSKKFQFGQFKFKSEPRQGPSLPASAAPIPWLSPYGQCMNYDNVLAINCQIPELLDAWCKRQLDRSNGTCERTNASCERSNEACDGLNIWPSAETVEEIAQLPSCVVNVGQKGSPNEKYQWRISFTQAEMCLIRSLNDTQLKMFILLRKIAKNLLHKQSDDITSYVIKNLVFWCCENCETVKFTHEFLLERLADALAMLKDSILRKDLPNYMIPQRNLFHGKLKSQNEIDRLLLEIEKFEINHILNFQMIFELPYDVKVPIFQQSKRKLQIVANKIEPRFIERLESAEPRTVLQQYKHLYTAGILFHPNLLLVPQTVAYIFKHVLYRKEDRAEKTS